MSSEYDGRDKDLERVEVDVTLTFDYTDEYSYCEDYVETIRKMQELSGTTVKDVRRIYKSPDVEQETTAG